MQTKDLSSAEAGYEGLNFETTLRESLACGSLACGILTVDPEGKITSLTPEAERALHLPAASSQGITIEFLPVPLRSIVREVLKCGQPVLERRVMLSANDAGSIAYSVTAFPVSPAKPVAGVAMWLRDLSGIAKMEDHLRRLNRLAGVGTLSASMAHEIRNALVAIKTFVDLLLEKNPDAELAGTVRREIGRVDTIVAQMLKFAAPAHPAFLPVRLHEILDHSLRLAQHRAGGKIVSFQREFNASPDFFSGDDHQLEQAFVNLLINGVEAIGGEGCVTVCTDLVDEDNSSVRLREGSSPRFLRLKFSDTGAGIEPGNLHRIFEPFFTTKHGGTGLGLAVTRRIIEEHNGSIWVESQAGQGTTFTVLLPATQDQSD
jgi:signal transduction histidine kinase